MTWAMWGTTLRGLAEFVEWFEFRELDFEVWEVGGSGEGCGKGVVYLGLGWKVFFGMGGLFWGRAGRDRTMSLVGCLYDHIS